MAEEAQELDPALVEPPPGSEAPATPEPPKAPAYNREQLFADYERYKKMGEEMFQKGREHLTRTEQIAKEQPSPAGTIQGIEQELAKIPEMPKPPDLPRVPRHEDFIDKTQANLMKAVGNIMIAANIGGSRIRGTRAMNAMAASINGFVEGNNERAAQALQEYDREVRAQAVQYQNMSDWYRNVLATSRSNIEARMRSYEMQARAWGDKLGAEKAVGGDIAGMMNHADALSAQSMTLMNHLEQLKLQEMSKRLEAARLEETVRYHNLKIGAAGAGGSEKDMLKTAHDIMGEARQQVESQFKGPLGQIDMSSLGKTPEERGAKFQQMINDRANQLAAERGLPNLFKQAPQKEPPANLHQALLSELKSGRIKSSSQAVDYLKKQGLGEDEAMRVAAGVLQIFVNKK